MPNNDFAKTPDSMKFWQGMNDLQKKMESDPDLKSEFLENPQSVMRSNGIDCPILMEEGGETVNFTSLLEKSSPEGLQRAAEQLLEQASMAPGTQAFVGIGAVAVGAAELLLAADTAIILYTYVLVDLKTMVTGPEKPKPVGPGVGIPVIVNGGNPPAPEPEDDDDDEDIPDEFPEDDPDIPGNGTGSTSRTFDDGTGSSSGSFEPGSGYFGGTRPKGTGGGDTGDDPHAGKGNDTPGHFGGSPDDLGGRPRGGDYGDDPRYGGNDTPGNYGNTSGLSGTYSGTDSSDPRYGGNDTPGNFGGSLPGGNSGGQSSSTDGASKDSLVQGSKDWGSMTGPNGSIPAGSKDWESWKDPANAENMGSKNWESWKDPANAENMGSKDWKGSNNNPVNSVESGKTENPEKMDREVEPLPKETELHEPKKPRGKIGKGWKAGLLAVLLAGSYLVGSSRIQGKVNKVELTVPSGIALDVGDSCSIEFSVTPNNTEVSFSSGNSGVATVSGSTVTAVDSGDTAVLASYGVPSFFRPGVKLLGGVKSESIGVHVHGYEEGENTVPDCTTPGKLSEVCSCGKEKSQEFSALGHDYEETITEASCTDDGEKMLVCKRCGNTEKEVLPAIGHDYKDTIIEPDCVSPGRIVHTCQRCGDEYSENTSSALGHAYTVTASAPANHELTCSRCGNKISQAHSFGGTEHCTVCGYLIQIY